MLRVKSFSLVLLGSLWALNGCGSGGSGGSSTLSDGNGTGIGGGDVNLTKGYLIDSPVVGVAYECGAITGVTTQTGEFACSTTPVTFKIGEWVIGTINQFTADGKVFPQDLVGVARDNFTDPKLILLTRVLQSLDDDGNILEAITIPVQTAAKFNANANTATTAEELAAIAGVTLPSVEDAIAHLKEEIEKNQEDPDVTGGDDLASGTDTEAPKVVVPTSITINVTDDAGIPKSNQEIVAFLAAATATDNVGVVGIVSNDAPSVFPVGLTSVTFTAVDAAGNKGTAKSSVTVNKISVTPSGVGFVPKQPVYPQVILEKGLDLRDKIVSLYAEARPTFQAALKIDTSLFEQKATQVYYSNNTYYTELTREIQEGDNKYYRLTITVDMGVDKEFDGGDDEIISYSAIGQRYSANFTGKGADGKWLTSDDVVDFVLNAQSSTETFSYTDANGYKLTITGKINAGADQVLMTEDDKPLAYGISTPATQEAVAAITVFNGAGTDKKWFTADDAIREHTISRAKPDNKSYQSLTFNNKGTDGEWFTLDDVLLAYTAGVFNDANKLEYTAIYVSSGSDGVWFNADDPILSQIYFAYDGNGNNILTANHALVGSDGKWFTADDTVNAVSRVYTSGIKTQETIINAIGADGAWVTSDDTISQGIVYDVDGSIKYYVTSPGQDGLWFTADDTQNQVKYETALDANGNVVYREMFGYYDAFKYDTQNRLMGTVTVREENYGSDGIRRTADDIATGGWIQYYNADVKIERKDFLLSIGEDGTWFTEDDTYSGVEKTTFNAQGDKDQIMTFNAKGADETWNTSDDVLQTRKQFSYDDKNRLLDEVTYADSGEDNTWFTQDDVESARTQIRYDDVTQTRTDLPSASFGEDGEFGTSDDVIGGYGAVRKIYTLQDGEGQIIYSNAGEDGLWLTEDDVISAYYYYEYDAQGRDTISYTLKSIGADGLWLTEDDEGLFLRLSTHSADINYVTETRYDLGEDGRGLTADDTKKSQRLQGSLPANLF